MAAPALTFEADTHTYRYGGTVVPSVTQILAAAGLVDTTWYTEHARERGSAVHLACELDDKDDLDEGTVDDRCAGYLAAWRRFRQETDFLCRHIEMPVYSATWRYAGTLDRTGMLRGEPALLDIKTGAPHPATGVQLAAYQQAMLEGFGGCDCPHRYAVHLSADGRYRLVNYRDPMDFRVFLAALTVATWKEATR